MFEVFFCSISFTDCYGKKYNTILTRLHSSRMRTARALTVSPSMLAGGGGGEGVSARVGYLLWGVSALQGVSAPGGLSARGGCVCSGGGASAPRGECLLLGGWLLWGVSHLGGLLPRGCLLQGGVSAPGGVLLWGVYPSMH